MWIIPKSHSLASAYAPDMVASKEDLSLPELKLESSLMWRSKPTQLRIWLLRWSKIKWYRLLFGRILKPSMQNRFEIELTSSLAVIPASHFQQRGDEKERPTLDTSGPISLNSFLEYGQEIASLKTSKVISASDSKKLPEIWDAWATTLRQVYLARQKSARLTEENDCLSWPTPTQCGDHNRKGASKNSGDGLSTAVKQWPTPNVVDSKGGGRAGPGQIQLCHIAGQRGQAWHNFNGNRLESWATPQARDWKGPQGRAYKMESMDLPAMARKSGPGLLNSNWVEQLMGLDRGQTDLGSWGTE